MIGSYVGTYIYQISAQYSLNPTWRYPIGHTAHLHTQGAHSSPTTTGVLLHIDVTQCFRLLRGWLAGLIPCQLAWLTVIFVHLFPLLDYLSITIKLSQSHKRARLYFMSLHHDVMPDDFYV
jgi:hypothetical protein